MRLDGMYSVFRRISEIEKRFGLVKRAAVGKTGQDFSSKWRDLSEDIQKIKEGKYIEKPASLVDRNSNNIDSIIKEASVRYGVPEKVIRSVIQVESNFNPKAVSPKGAKGYMQLMPSVAKMLGVKNIFDPYENIMGGVKLLRSLLDKYGWDYKKALAAYNAGEYMVDKYNGVPPIAETQNYVKKIMSLIGF